MGYWGWRRLFAVFISVWVVGCTITHENAPTAPPTYPPDVTLVVRIPISPTPPSGFDSSLMSLPEASPTPMIYTVQEGDTLLQVALRFGVAVELLQAQNGDIEPQALQIGQPLVIPHPQFNALGIPILPTTTPPALPLMPPTCSLTPTNLILCLGQVVNPFDYALARVTVRVRLARADGSLLAEGETGIEQAMIPPGEAAPYRLLFQAKWFDYHHATAHLRSADHAAQMIGAFIEVVAEDQQRQATAGRYIINAILHNPGAQPARLVRAVAMLQDSRGQIIGYRVLELNRRLGAGARQPFEIQVMPQAAGIMAAHRLYIEAWPLMP